MRDAITNWLLGCLLCCGGCASADWALLVPRVTVAASGVSATKLGLPGTGIQQQRRAEVCLWLRLAWPGGAAVANRLRRRRTLAHQLQAARARLADSCRGWQRLAHAVEPPARRQVQRLCREMFPQR